MPSSATAHLQPHERIIFPWDVSRPFNYDDRQKLGKLLPHIGLVKLGFEAHTAIPEATLSAEPLLPPLLTSVGLQVLQFCRDHGKLVMGDLKFKDVRNTIAGAAKNLAHTKGVKIFTYHATMPRRNIEVILKETLGTECIAAGVTILTDHEPEDVEDIYHCCSLEEAFLGCMRRIQAAQREVGASAASVCSPTDLRLLLEQSDNYADLIKITPGIRSSEDPPDEQARTATATQAMELGADYEVIGRPISSKPDWVEAAKRLAGQIQKGLAHS